MGKWPKGPFCWLEFWLILPTMVSLFSLLPLICDWTKFGKIFVEIDIYIKKQLENEWVISGMDDLFSSNIWVQQVCN